MRFDRIRTEMKVAAVIMLLAVCAAPALASDPNVDVSINKTLLNFTESDREYIEVGVRISYQPELGDPQEIPAVLYFAVEHEGNMMYFTGLGDNGALDPGDFTTDPFGFPFTVRPELVEGNLGFNVSSQWATFCASWHLSIRDYQTDKLISYDVASMSYTNPERANEMAFIPEANSRDSFRLGECEAEFDGKCYARSAYCDYMVDGKCFVDRGKCDPQALADTGVCTELICDYVKPDSGKCYMRDRKICRHVVDGKCYRFCDFTAPDPVSGDETCWRYNPGDTGKIEPVVVDSAGRQEALCASVEIPEEIRFDENEREICYLSTTADLVEYQLMGDGVIEAFREIQGANPTGKPGLFEIGRAMGDFYDSNEGKLYRATNVDESCAKVTPEGYCLKKVGVVADYAFDIYHTAEIGGQDEKRALKNVNFIEKRRGCDYIEEGKCYLRHHLCEFVVDERCYRMGLSGKRERIGREDLFCDIIVDLPCKHNPNETCRVCLGNLDRMCDVSYQDSSGTWVCLEQPEDPICDSYKEELTAQGPRRTCLQLQIWKPRDQLSGYDHWRETKNDIRCDYVLGGTENGKYKDGVCVQELCADEVKSVSPRQWTRRWALLDPDRRGPDALCDYVGPRDFSNEVFGNDVADINMMMPDGSFKRNTLAGARRCYVYDDVGCKEIDGNDCLAPTKTCERMIDGICYQEVCGYKLQQLSTSTGDKIYNNRCGDWSDNQMDTLFSRNVDQSGLYSPYMVMTEPGYNCDGIYSLDAGQEEVGVCMNNICDRKHEVTGQLVSQGCFMRLKNSCDYIIGGECFKIDYTCDEVRLTEVWDDKEHHKILAGECLTQLGDVDILWHYDGYNYYSIADSCDLITEDPNLGGTWCFTEKTCDIIIFNKEEGVHKCYNVVIPPDSLPSAANLCDTRVDKSAEGDPAFENSQDDYSWSANCDYVTRNMQGFPQKCYTRNGLCLESDGENVCRKRITECDRIAQIKTGDTVESLCLMRNDEGCPKRIGDKCHQDFGDCDMIHEGRCLHQLDSCHKVHDGKCYRTSDLYYNEIPTKNVVLTDYHIDKTEVTNCMFRSWAESEDNASEYKPGYWSRSADSPREFGPAVNVSWFQADAFCKAIGKELCTEAQWEKACEGPENNVYPYSNRMFDSPSTYYDDIKDRGIIFRCRDSGDYMDGMLPVGAKKYCVNDYGLHDMAGNAAEWVSDWYAYATYSYLSEGAVDPAGPDKTRQKSVRGGTWISELDNSRCAKRFGCAPGAANNWVGFRCCKKR